MNVMQSIRTVQGDTVDLICHKYYGKTEGITEQVIEANPHIVGFGPVLPSNTLLQLPELPKPVPQKLINLWD